jgi:hypothetical protein
VTAVVKLWYPVRRFKRSQRNWKRAVNVVSAAKAFQTSGTKRAVRRINSAGEEIIVELESDEDEEDVDEKGNKIERYKQAGSGGGGKNKIKKYLSHDEKLKELSKKPGWVPPPDLEQKKVAFDKAQVGYLSLLLLFLLFPDLLVSYVCVPCHDAGSISLVFHIYIYIHFLIIIN